MESSDAELQELRRLLAELTARVFRLEHALRLQPGIAVQAPASPNATARTAELELDSKPDPPVPVAPPLSPPPQASVGKQAGPDLESRIGSHWLNRIGITAVLIGVSYFLKFAFDNNWIGPSGRVAIGLLAGIAVMAWSETFRRRGYRVFSHSLKAVGIGVLYLSLYAAFQVYNLVPGSVAFTMMLAVTAATAVMAWTQDAEILAAFALIGGFSTPFLLSTGQNREVALFAYVAILDLGALALLVLKPWRRLLVLSYVGTLSLYVGWYASFYDLAQLRMTVGFATLFFAIFALAPMVARPAEKGRWSDVVPPLIAVVNAAGYFLQIYVMFEEIGTRDTAWFALALAALYVFLSRNVSRPGSQCADGENHRPATPGASHRFHHDRHPHSPRRTLGHHRMVRRSGHVAVGGRPNSLRAAQCFCDRRACPRRRPLASDRQFLYHHSDL